nr:transposase, MuDR, MULE transposase domain protein [Tanacetum cinerariifolium]
YQLLELMIRARPPSARYTVAKTGTSAMLDKSNKFAIETDFHLMGMLDGSSCPYPSWDDVYIGNPHGFAELPTDRAALDEYIGVWFRCEVPDAVELRSMVRLKENHAEDLEQLGILNVVVARMRVLKGKDIQLDILSDYKTSISYQQAWRGKDYGLNKIMGSLYESFEMLSYYCYNLERKNQGSVTRIKTDDKGVFEMLFISLGASIRTFLNYLRPLLIIDVAHQKGEYKGTNLVAIGMDGNNQIMPVAFGICKGETDPCWSWWMSVLKERIGDHNNLLFISDRHPAIALAVHNEFPLAFHVTYTPDEFIANMNIMQVVQPDAYQKLCQAGTQRWSRAHCTLVRYNYMTSNSVESVNACSVINRKLSVLTLAETYCAMLQDWYFERQKLTANLKYEITDWVADKVHKRKLKSATWIVHGVNQYVYQVLNGRYNHQVNLETGVCECGKWQLSGIPCGHVIAVTSMLVSFDMINHQFHVLDIPSVLRYQLPDPFYISHLGNSLVISGNLIIFENRYIYVWLLEVDGAFVTSWRMLFVIPSTNVVKLIGFTNDDDPIVEVDRGRMLHPLQVDDHTSQEFHNVGISADGGSFFISPYKESLILLNV